MKIDDAIKKLKNYWKNPKNRDSLRAFKRYYGIRTFDEIKKKQEWTYPEIISGVESMKEYLE